MSRKVPRVRIPASPPAEARRSVPLDVLRALAILLVLGRHIPYPFGTTPSGWLYAPLNVLHLGGWIGVDLFFVLSGYLVSGLLFDEYRAKGAVDPARFLIRRGFRIYPAYYALFIFSVAASWHWVRLRNIVVDGLFLQNYFLQWSMWNHTWSLAVEEHFYLMLAFLLWHLSKKSGPDPFKGLMSIMAVLAVFCLGMRFTLPAGRVAILTLTHMRMDSLFFGVLIAYLSRYYAPFNPYVQSRKKFLILLGVLTVLPAFFLDPLTDPFIMRGGITLFYIGFGSWVAVATQPGAITGLWKPLEQALASIGRNSYSIYLWHMPIRTLALPWIRREVGAEFTLFPQILGFIALSVAAGYLSTHYLEKPFLRLRDWRFPSAAA